MVAVVLKEILPNVNVRQVFKEKLVKNQVSSYSQHSVITRQLGQVYTSGISISISITTCAWAESMSWTTEFFVLHHHKGINQPWSTSCTCVCLYAYAYVTSINQAIRISIKPVTIYNLFVRFMIYEMKYEMIHWSKWNSNNKLTS